MNPRSLRMHTPAPWARFPNLRAPLGFVSGSSASRWCRRGLYAGLLMSLLAAPALAQGPSGETVPSLLVNGNAELEVEPDQAVVRLGVSFQEPEAAAAQRRVNTTAHAILEAVKAVGIAESAIQTSRLDLSPVYDHRPRTEGGPPVVVGYQASNVVTVTLEDLSKVGAVVDAAIKAGANQVEGISFELEDDDAAKQRALGQAIEDAKNKAGAMARALGLSLGPVLEVHESGAFVAPPPYQARFRMQEMAVVSDSTPVSPGMVTVTANVTVRYRLTS